MDITYRIAALPDLDEVWSFVHNVINNMISQNILQWDELYPDKEILREDILKGQLRLGIVHEQIATIYVINQECEDEYKYGKWKYEDISCCVIHRLCVNPTFQNIGIGRITMLYIEKEVQSMGMQAIRLDAFLQNLPALKLYNNLGYARVGEVDWRKGRFYLLEKLITTESEKR